MTFRHEDGSPKLCEILHAMVNREAIQRRNEASTLLMRMNEPVWSPYLRRRFTRSQVPDAVVQDAVSHLVLQASVGTALFRGTTDAEAYAWCYLVLKNSILSWLRKRKRDVTSSSDHERADVELDALTDGSAVDDETEARLEARIGDAVDLLLALAKNQARPQDRDSVEHGIRCFLAYRRNDDIEDQIDTFGFYGAFAGRSPLNPKERRLARDRVYQYRHRGAQKARTAVRTLIEERQRAGDVELGEELRLLMRIVDYQATGGE